ncbi:MAG TPA: DMT family transporter [Thermoanaerobaculia bacterium]|nr:DMT family transporter [Thermoanaerobaculia bacterium]
MPARRPLVMIAVSAVCFAFMAFAAKLAAARLPGGQIAFVRFALMLAPVLLPQLARRALVVQRLDLLAYRGLFGGVAVLCYFLALAHIPVGIATLLNYSSPIFSVAFARFFLGERLDRRLALPLAAALLGLACAAVGGGDGGRPGVGDGGENFAGVSPWVLAGFASAVLSGAALAAVRAARRTEGSWAIYGSFSLCGLLATAPFALPGWVAPTAREWLLLGVVGATSVVAQLLMTYAYRWVTNVQAGVLSQLTVVTSMLLGVVFLGDRLTPVQVLGTALALGGVVGVAWIQATPRAVE